ncbi:unnamed protein product [Coregonus sp. 'balchen']|nr:unnamed protein product [Coregonus sp. 'balchen']
MECSGGVGKGGSIVRVKVKKKRKPEEPLQVLSEESSDEGGLGRSVVLREVKFKVLVKFKDQGGVTARIDPNKEDLTRDEFYFIRQVELAQWKNKSQQLRGHAYTFYSVKQEKIMDELDEAKFARMRGAKTGTN